MREYFIDAHMHTLASGHAYNTLKEMISSSIEKQMEVICITEHGPAMPGTAHPYYHTNMRAINFDTVKDIKIIKGLEANITDYDGNTDYDTLGDSIADLKYIIASFHSVCLNPGTEAQNTAAYIGAIKKPYTMTVGHIDDGRIPCDFEAVIRAAKENDVLVELNNSSMSPSTFRVNSVQNGLEYLKICKELGAMIVLSSDAHYEGSIGDFSNLYPMLEKVKFPEELIINKKDKFLEWVNRKYERRLAQEGKTNAV